MSFLGKLAQQINNQFSLGENETKTLDKEVDGKLVKYGSLGDLASRLDQSAQRKYVEDGFYRSDVFNANPKIFEILMQEPNATILLKKRMFSSVAENHRTDFMDKDEKLFYKATKILFQNKCRQISSLEKLSKISKIGELTGKLSDQLMAQIISLSDGVGAKASSGDNLFSNNAQNKDVSNFTKAVDRIRRLNAFNNSSNTTNWVTDSTNLFSSQFGEGTGVIEITNFVDFSTTVTNSIKNAGNCRFTITDPYESMLITEYDIEKAISDATNSFYNNKTVQLGISATENVIANLQSNLNSLRKARGASPITINVNADTLLGRRVTAILERIGTELLFNYSTSGGIIAGLGGLTEDSVSVAIAYLKDGDVAGIDGLDTEPVKFTGTNNDLVKLQPQSELSVFKRLICAIYNKLQLTENSKNTFQTTNIKTNYARRKMRFTFLGKMIIQPMDIIHVYINSKSRYDNKVMSGINNLFNGFSYLQDVNKTVTDFKNAFDTLFNPSDNIAFQLEKNAFVGPDFPNYLWSVMRGQFLDEKEGTHVFAGIIQSVNSRWSDGKFVTAADATDNSAYLEMGRINFKPGVDVFNGLIFDPLTPFKTRFDSITSNADNTLPVLLEENQWLLGSSQDKDAPLVKFKLGPNVGQKVTQENYVQDTTIDKNTGKFTKVFYAPDGLVYKWKEGINVVVQYGNSLELNNPNISGVPNINKEPFAGQDIMNVISLSITGYPYNFATYWKATNSLSQFGNDPQNNQDSAYSYSDSLRADLQKQNILWGNFIPFKNLVIDEESFKLVMGAQARINSKNNDLDTKLKKLADIQNSMNIFGASNVFSGYDSAKYSSAFKQAQEEANSLIESINGIVEEIQMEDTSFIGQTGNDTSFDFNSFLNQSKASEQNDPVFRKNLRKQINYLTRRMSYNVKGNEDKNLFIVDDTYDKDYDMLAYEKSLTDGIKLYNNEFTTVKEKIISSADLLNLEVFCDTQGHIRVRQPQYNRMPTSVFYRMMYLKKTFGIQVFPEFLNNLFTSQLESLKNKIEIIEDQIRLDCAALGFDNDFDALYFLLSNDSTKNKGSTFFWITNENGKMLDISTILLAANPDTQDNATNENIELFQSIKNQASNKTLTFDTTRRYKTVLKSITNNKLDAAGFGIYDVPDFNSNSRVEDLIDRLKLKSGVRIYKNDFIISTGSDLGSTTIDANQRIDVLKITNDLSDKLSQRQKTIHLLYSAIKNLTEYKSLDDDNDKTANQLLAPGSFGNSNIPEVFEHMLEDEKYDDYGVGSGSRYIIKRSQIKNMDISENSPDYNMVEVRGYLNEFAPDALAQGLNSFPSGGNAMTSALAVDNDMWRNYGLKSQATITAPFLSDPNTQCAPYAAMLLSRARKDILKCTITISGNEYMQPGEVVFIEDRGLLFYITSVSHSFTFGNGFSTSLQLSYGHTPGEYIPTPQDMIGKLIYNNKDSSSVIVQRQSSALNEENLGIIIKDRFAFNVLDKDAEGSSKNSYQVANMKTINNILYTAAYTLNSNNAKGNNKKASVELRVYSTDGEADSQLLSFAEDIKLSLTSDDYGPKQNFNAATANSKSPRLNPDDVSIVTVSLGNDEESQSPSRKAIDAARNIMSISGEASSNKDKLRTILYRQVIDIWIKFENVSS